MIHVKMKWTGPRSKELHKHLRYAYAHVANWWHKHALPLHFTKRGAQKYQYEKRQGERAGGGRRRKGSYTARKIKKHGHSLPLVYTGFARMLSRMRNIRATGKGARIRIAVGNMLPASARTVCADINPAVVTKLADRGSFQAIGIVTDVGLFVEQLADELAGGS